MIERPRGSAYAGDISVEQAWQMLSEDPAAVLVDVRTMAEWTYVGTPDLSSLGKRPVLVEWQRYPDFGLNPQFSEQLTKAVPDPQAPVLFLCRSGVRSAAAAAVMTARGYAQCFNVAAGFEGDADAGRHRGQTSGWKVAGLPWVQS